MIRKDKALLENLTKKYGKKKLLNLLSQYDLPGKLERDFLYIENKILSIFDEFDIDYICIEKFPELYINVNERYAYKCIGILTDGEQVVFELVEDKNKIIEFPLNDVMEVFCIKEIYEWLKDNEDDLITYIEKDVRSWRN